MKNATVKGEQYEKLKAKKKVLLIGPFPPPFGGVSVHIQRLSNLLNSYFTINIVDESRNIKASIFNIRTLKAFRYLSLIKRSDIIHIHSGKYILRLLHFMVAKIFHKQIIFTVHAYPENGKKIIEKYVDNVVFSKADKVVFVSEKIAKNFNLRQSYIREAFLPPNLEQEVSLPIDLISWIKRKKEQGYFICSGNAWRLDVYNNEDLYGLDLFIEVANFCKINNIKIAFVFTISDPDGKVNLKEYRQLIKKYDIKDTIYINESAISFIRLIIESEIILRPTNTDGDALTIREGIYFNKIVIASDIVKRPDETILFQNRSSNSLNKKIKLAYVNLIQNQNPSQPFSYSYHSQSTLPHLTFYKDLLYN